MPNSNNLESRYFLRFVVSLETYWNNINIVTFKYLSHSHSHSQGVVNRLSNVLTFFFLLNLLFV